MYRRESTVPDASAYRRNAPEVVRKQDEETAGRQQVYHLPGSARVKSKDVVVPDHGLAVKGGIVKVGKNLHTWWLDYNLFYSLKELAHFWPK